MVPQSKPRRLRHRPHRRVSMKIPSHLRYWFRSSLFWILGIALVLRLAGLWWGLPASHGWDDDGIAPRDFLVGLVLTYSPGSYFAHPPLHMILLAILTAPGWLIALFHAHPLTPRGVISEIIQVPYMTFFAFMARLMSVAMSLGTIFLIGKIAETIGGKRAGWFAAAACALNAALTYYGQVTNLDGPYLFWSALSLLGWMRMIAEREPRHARWAALSAAAAIATKDQAYAIFLLSVPPALLIWFAGDAWPRKNAGRLVASVLIWSCVAVLALMLVDGAITNPSGFAARISFLTGPASQNYLEYQNDLAGRLQLLTDMWLHIPWYYPYAAVLLGALGVVFHVVRSRTDHAVLVVGMLPLSAIVSFTLSFNLAVLRTEPRFLLPQSVFVAVYIGLAIDRLAFVCNPIFRHGARLLIAATACLALYACISIDHAFIADPRYDAERWMAAHVRAGEHVETYGLNTYLPRFPKRAIVQRIDVKPLARRDPLPNVTELDAAFGSMPARRPRYLVVTGFWVNDYLSPNNVRPGFGRTVPIVQSMAWKNRDAQNYFRALFAGKLRCQLAHESSYHRGIWRSVEGYESLSQPLFLFTCSP